MAAQVRKAFNPEVIKLFASARGQSQQAAAQ